MRRLLGAALFLSGCSMSRSDPARQDAGVADVASALSRTPDEAFLRAERPRPFSFPEDHGPHPGFKTEWWYLTGTLESGSGRKFGYQLTVFRSQLAPRAARRPSSWAANDAYMAHFTVTDVEGRAFHSAERFARGAQGLAGAEGRPLRVWVEDWSIEGDGVRFPARLRAADGEVAIDLALDARRPPVAHGDGGLSRKGPAPGQASYYYSSTRLQSLGSLTVRGETHLVTGWSWLDREWSTSALSPDQAGWDWFAFRLDDGRDLMFYRLRKKDGSTDPFSAGTLVGADGKVRKLSSAGLRLEPAGRWTSPRGGSYPSSWTLEIPSERLSLDIRPWLADQELDVSFRYWEGAAEARGTAAGKPVRGEGYVELVGYARSG